MRCAFRLPADSKIAAGERCVLEFLHGGYTHVVGDHVRSASTYWRVDPGTRTAKVVLHVDLRNGEVMTDDEGYALWQYMDIQRPSSETQV